MSGVRVSLNQQIAGVGDALAAQQMLLDSGRAKLGASDARYQMERLRAARASLLAIDPVSDIMRAVLRLSPERLASLREMLGRWGQDGAADAGGGDNG